MRDPHVDWLQYRLECAPTTTFQNAPPIEYDTAAFRMTLRDGQIRFDFKEHHAGVQAAQGSIADFLRAWEIEAGLTVGAGEVRFVYDHAGISDRNPPAPGEPVEIGIQVSAQLGFSASVSVARPAYPEPPKAFKVSPT